MAGQLLASAYSTRNGSYVISFLRNYLTKDLVLREDICLFQKQGRDYKIIDKEWRAVRDQLVSIRVNGGFPFIHVTDGDYLKNGELYLNIRMRE